MLNLSRYFRLLFILSLLPPLASVGKESSSSLKEAYNEAFLMGVATNADIDSGKSDWANQLVLTHFNSITAENELKAGQLCPAPGEYDFCKADQFVSFGEAHDMFILGHTLVWHNQTPDWFFKNNKNEKNNPEEQLDQMRRHIERVASRYAGRVHAWDVVNEVIDDHGEYRPTVWVNGVGGGDVLVKHAFQYASQYAPDAELYYNDFNAWRPAKVKGIVRMVKMLQKDGIRIDGIGIQGHWGLNFPKNEYIEEAIEAYSALGLKVMITELDVDVLPLTKEGQIIGQGMMHPQFQEEEFKEFLDPYASGLPDDIEKAFTDRYIELFSLFYRLRSKIDRVTLWGLEDDMSWKNGYPIPNRTNYPLLWDRSKTAKRAVDELLQIPGKID